MILPLGAIFPDTKYPFPNMYGLGYGFGGRAPRKMAVVVPLARPEARDTVFLSPAARRILDQAERLKQLQPNHKE